MNLPGQELALVAESTGGSGEGLGMASEAAADLGWALKLAQGPAKAKAPGLGQELNWGWELGLEPVWGLAQEQAWALGQA